MKESCYSGGVCQGQCSRHEDVDGLLAVCLCIIHGKLKASHYDEQLCPHRGHAPVWGHCNQHHRLLIYYDVIHINMMPQCLCAIWIGLSEDNSSLLDIYL